MRAHGLTRYHRPSRLDEALALAAQGAVPLAGGTRLLARDAELPAVVDLAGLDLANIALEGGDGDLVLGAMVTLQQIVDSSVAAEATAGLLPEACRAQSASLMLRNMATLGGESVEGDPASEVVAALLALNAIYVVSRPEGPLEVPALRFLKDPAEDLAGGGLLTSIIIPGAPDGTALERVAVIPSAPSLLAVAVTVAFAGDHCARARIAFTGLKGRPARIMEAEGRIEGTPIDAASLEKALAQIDKRAAYRDDAHASAAYRAAIGRVLARRGLERAVERARGAKRAEPVVRRWPEARPPARTARAGFTSGRLDLVINGEPRRPEAEARTTLLDLLRREGCFGVKHGCETGECGACAVLLDGRPVNSCLTLAAQADGRSITTVEGLGTPDALDPIQAAFVDTGAIQCGYCTPAMELCAKALLEALPQPTEAEARDALAGCLCRCTGYVKPVEAVRQAALAAPAPVAGERR